MEWMHTSIRRVPEETAYAQFMTTKSLGEVNQIIFQNLNNMQSLQLNLN